MDGDEGGRLRLMLADVNRRTDDGAAHFCPVNVDVLEVSDVVNRAIETVQAKHRGKTRRNSPGLSLGRGEEDRVWGKVQLGGHTTPDGQVSCLASFAHSPRT